MNEELSKPFLILNEHEARNLIRATDAEIEEAKNNRTGLIREDGSLHYYLSRPIPTTI